MKYHFQNRISCNWKEWRIGHPYLTYVLGKGDLLWILQLWITSNENPTTHYVDEKKNSSIKNIFEPKKARQGDSTLSLNQVTPKPPPGLYVARNPWAFVDSKC